MKQKKTNTDCSLFEFLLSHFNKPQKETLAYFGHNFTQDDMLEQIIPPFFKQ